MDIIATVIVGPVSVGIFVGIVLHYFKKHDKKEDERYTQQKELWLVEKNVNDRTADLACTIGDALEEKEICNGNVSGKICELKTARKARNEFYVKIGADVASK